MSSVDVTFERIIKKLCGKCEEGGGARGKLQGAREVEAVVIRKDGSGRNGRIPAREGFLAREIMKLGGE